MEIQELKNRIKELEKENETLKENNLSYQEELAKAWNKNEELKRKTYKAYINDKGEIQFAFDNYISKDKIRTKIEKIKKEMKTENYIVSLYAIGILEELLGDE